jgi:hypothetical protein
MTGDLQRKARPTGQAMRTTQRVPGAGRASDGTLSPVGLGTAEACTAT